MLKMLKRQKKRMFASKTKYTNNTSNLGLIGNVHSRKKVGNVTYRVVAYSLRIFSISNTQQKKEIR